MSNIAVTLVQIWKISESAVFNFLLIAPVIDLAISVVVFSLIERVDLVEVITDWCDMVCYNIDHNRDTFAVASVDKGLEIIC